MKSMNRQINSLALKVGCAGTTIVNICAGRRRPSWGLAKRLAHHTGSDPVLWMDGSKGQIRAAIESWAKTQETDQAA